jgi:malate synthase
MTERINLAGLMVDERLARFIEGRALPGTGVSLDAFWGGFSAIVRDLSPRNRVLLARREVFQKQIDEWHRIGYLLPEGPAFRSRPPMSTPRSPRFPARSWWFRSPMPVTR